MSDAVRRESPLARFHPAARSAQVAGDERAAQTAGDARAAPVVASAPVPRIAPEPGVAIGERPFLGHLDLRGAATDSKFVTAVREALGVAPPVAPNTVVAALGNVLYWLGPDEWLIVTPAGREPEVEQSLRGALRDVRSALTDVSGGQTVIVIRGAAAREVLAKGCPLDLHPREFGVGRCAQSHLAKASVLLRIVDATPTFEIVVRRSFADYLWLWLDDAAAEYGIALPG